MAYKILFPDSKFHIIIFLKKYGNLSSLLEDLVTRKMTVNSANADQISFIVNLMHGYDEQKLFDSEALESKFFHNTALIKANKVY